MAPCSSFQRTKRNNKCGLSLSQYTVGYIFHIGDNHPHVEIILKSMGDFEKAKEVYARFAAKAVELGGSPSAEHGIGKIKTEYMRMMYGERGVEELRRVKAILDPKDILCRGNLIGVVQ